MNETGLDGSDFCNCAHDRERHSGGYGDCLIGDCNCRGFDDTLAEVKAEARKAVELPPIVITQADIDAAEKRFPFPGNYHERYPYAESLVRDRQLLATLTTIAVLQDRVKELEAELDALKAADAWIDVRERMPKENTDCDVWCEWAVGKPSRVANAKFQSDHIGPYWTGPYGHISSSVVTYWRPLPSPPTQEAK